MDLKAQIQGLNTQQSDAKIKLHHTLLEYIWHKKKGFDAIQQEESTFKISAKNIESRKISMYMIGG